LKEINGKAVLKYIHESLSQVTDNENIIVATSEEDTDNPIVDYCKVNKITFFRGSLNNVAQRFLNCAKQYKLDFATRINGDNLFVDVDAIKNMLDIVKTNQYDFVSNVKKITFPKGMSVEIVRTSHFEKKYLKFDKKEFFEHVTLYLYQNDSDENYFYYYNTTCPEAAGIQLAIDDVKDFEIASKIIANFDREHFTYSLKEVFEIYKRVTNKV
jgi:spore coat polysaccharide biosynthesis protein SpsF